MNDSCARIHKKIAVVAISFLTLGSFVYGQQKAKDLFRQGENDLRQNKLPEAYVSLKQACSADPNNKKYKSKLDDVSKLLSRQLQSDAHVKMQADPKSALVLLNNALSYDATNTLAVADVKALNGEIADAARTLANGTGAMNAGDLVGARQLFDKVWPYRSVLDGYDTFKRQLGAADDANSALAYWKNQQRSAALSALQRAEAQGADCEFVKQASLRIKRDLSEELIRNAAAGVTDRPIQSLLAQWTAAKEASTLDGSNTTAVRFREETESRLAALVLSNVTNSGSSARNNLALLQATKEAIQGDPRFNTALGNVQSAAYPAVRARVESSGSCQLPGVRESLQIAVQQGLGAVSGQSASADELTIDVHDLSCAVTDIPRQSVEYANSTYAAGQQQLVNPGYVQMQSQLAQAQSDLASAQAAYTYNPNFFNGLSLGLARSKVNKIMRAMSSIPPYSSQDVLQQYQYEKYEAFRSYKIEATVSVRAGSEAHAFNAQQNVTSSAEDRQFGVSGVLPQDRSGLRTSEPTLKSTESLASSAGDTFRQKVSAAARELVAEYFATRVNSSNLSSDSRLASLLYLDDIASGTSYESDRPRWNAILTAAVLDENGRRAFVPPLLHAPGPSIDATGIAGAGTIQKAMAGVVSIETDAAKGTGFFVSSGCLVATNEHVIHGAESIVLRTSTKKLLTATVLSTDANRDLALVSTSTHSCEPLRIAENRNSFGVGDEVYAIGNPLGLSDTVTRGIISAFRTTSDGVHFVQIDAAINPGNSGGPLILKNGDVVGINSMTLTGTQGLNFAVAATELKNSFARYLF